LLHLQPKLECIFKHLFSVLKSKFESCDICKVLSCVIVGLRDGEVLFLEFGEDII